MANYDVYASLTAGTELVYEGTSYFLTVRTPDQRFMAMSSLGVVLMMPDETGIPRFPTVSMMRAAQRDRKLVIRSEPLDDPVRRDARAEEATLEEVEKRDSWAPLRRKVAKAWDLEPDDAKPMRSDAGLEAWIREVFGEVDIIARHGRVPCGTTIRTWIKTRGRGGDRRLVDMDSRSGKVPRRRRFDPIVIALGKLHALAAQATKGRSQRTAYDLLKRDVGRAFRGEEITFGDKVFEYERPKKRLPVYGREIFRLECHKAKSKDTTKTKWTAKAANALYGGGGKAKEPTRFMELVEQDDTPFPKYFLIDLVNRVPVGPATVVFSMDVFTRCFIGWDVSFDKPSLSTWMRAVAHGAEPKEVPKRLRDAHPELADVFGYVVGAYLYDNALQNVSKAVEDAGGDLCHEVRLAGEGEPTHKAHVERGHQTVQMMMAEVPGSSFDIPLMRKYGYDPEKHVVVTIEEFRVLLAEAIATYHLTPSKALNGRCPLDVWIEQMKLHGHSQARDHDQFLRCIGDVQYLTFTRTGVDLHRLDYSDGDGNAALLADLAAALGPAKDTVNPSYRVKVKSYTDDIGFVSVWNPHTRRYVAVPCTKQRYAKGKPLWLHERTLEHAAAMGRNFHGLDDEAAEEALIEIRAGFCDAVEAIAADAAARQRQTLGRLIDQPNVRRYLGASINFLRVQPSPSGMESRIDHELRASVRRDDMVEPQRRRRGGANVERDRRDVGEERQGAAEISRRGAPTGMATSNTVRRGGRTMADVPAGRRRVGSTPAPQKTDGRQKARKVASPLPLAGFK